MIKLNQKIILFFLSSNLLVASISGIVFQDLPVKQQTLNIYGVKDSNEQGVKGIKVTSYPDNISTLTDDNGRWSLNTQQDSRIEFSSIPSYLKESPSGTINNSSIQFVTNDTNNSTFGLYNPNDYSKTITPSYATSIKISGKPIGSTIQGIHTVNYAANGLNADYVNYLNQAGTGYIPQDEITIDQIGSVWGKAYQKNKKRLFVSSMLQRHIGFAKTPSDIYVIKYVNGIAKSMEGSFSLQGIQPSNGGVPIDLGNINRLNGADYILEANPLLPNRDLDAYAKVGKISYGGIDIEYNKNKLWLINLKQKALISVDINGSVSSFNSSIVNQYHFQDLPNVPTCIGGEIRPWAIKVHEDKGYVGLVCDASTSNSNNNLHAYVLSFSLKQPELGFETKINFPLNYSRQWKNWEAWRNDFFEPIHPNILAKKFFPQPILSDIEFDEKNNMYITFLDRYALQLGYTHLKAYSGSTQIEHIESFGELLKVCHNNNLYALEGTANCSTSNYTDLNISEFFNDLGGDGNKESSLGALAILKGSNQILHTTLDPHPEVVNIRGEKPYWYTMGTQTLNLTNGKIDNWYSNTYTALNGLGYKGNHLGDIEIITDPAPTEIGNLIWLDTNANGIQDANENGIENVQINLICNGIIESTANSNATGNYIFSNDATNNISNTGSHQYNISNLIENTDNCYLSIPNISGTNQQASLNNYVLTTVNIGEGNNSNLNDSNAEVNGTTAKIMITALDIPINGSNNHSFDIGFKLLSNLTIGNRLWIDSNKNGVQDNNESGYAGATVTLYNNATCSGSSLRTTLTGNDGLYHFTGIGNGTYCIQFTNLPANHRISLANQGGNDTLDSDANSNAQIQNIQLTVDSLNADIGIYPSAIVAPPAVISGGSNTLVLGNRLWVDNNKDGIQDNNESGYAGATATLYNSDCSGTPIATTSTGNDGLYEFTNLATGTYCIVFTNLPTSHTISLANQGGDDALDSDANSNAQIQNIQLTNSSRNEDIGIYPTSVVLGTTACQEMTVSDDIQNANPDNATTVIDILNNDTGTKANQRIKFLSNIDGRTLWENQDVNITNITTFDTLVVDGEGTWSIIDNKVSFTALNSFDGKIPTPVYYVIDGSGCTDSTRYTNVGKITINSACTCPTYSTKSIASFNILALFILAFLTFGFATPFLKKEV